MMILVLLLGLAKKVKSKWRKSKVKSTKMTYVFLRILCTRMGVSIKSEYCHVESFTPRGSIPYLSLLFPYFLFTFLTKKWYF